jgi:hypothetical protein
VIPIYEAGLNQLVASNAAAGRSDFSLDHARTKIANWAGDYNGQRPHSALGYLTPAAYAANLTATSDRQRNPDQLRRSHVALPAPDGVKPILIQATSVYIFRLMEFPDQQLLS